jgi:hypothetical protein
MDLKFGAGTFIVILLIIGGFFLVPPRSVNVAPAAISHTPTTAATQPTPVASASAPIAGASSVIQKVFDTFFPPTILPQTQVPFDAAAYDAKLRFLAHVPAAANVVEVATSTASSTASSTKKIIRPWPASLWPVTTAAYPNAGAILPMNRIVAYYGNLYSRQMGVLGEYPRDQVLQMLASTTALWEAADPATPVVPALDYIAVTAQGSPGADGKYRLRMPDDQVENILQMADDIHGVVFLDVQVGLSDVQTEIPLLEKYLKLPQVHLSLDPEFSMKHGERPGTVIGTMDAADINFAEQYLAKLVRDNNLPPKMLVIHRFTDAMLTNYKNIKPLPEVQIVLDMDGFGAPARKIKTYHDVAEAEPIQFTGFKLFYKNDVNVGGHLMAPEEVLKLTPAPSYIQYQ